MKIYVLREYDEIPDGSFCEYNLMLYADLPSAQTQLKEEYKKRCESLQGEHIDFESKEIEEGYQIDCDNGFSFKFIIEEEELKGKLYTLTEFAELEDETYAYCNSIHNSEKEAIVAKEDLKNVACRQMINPSCSSYSVYNNENMITYLIDEIKL